MYRCIFLLVLAATQASVSAYAATYKCVFDSECVGVEACQKTNFELTIEGFDYAANIVTDSQTFIANKFASNDGKFKGVYTTTERADFHVVTIEESGESHYSVHMPTSNLAIYYKGKCGNIK